MRIAILVLLLAVVSNSAMAEWVSLGVKRDNTIYANPDTVRSGNNVKMSVLWKYKTARYAGNGKKYMSSVHQVEFDCKEKQFTIRAINQYAGNMGEGDMVYSHNFNNKLTPIPPGSVVETEFKYACNKK
jgi:hypothetical protein